MRVVWFAALALGVLGLACGCAPKGTAIDQGTRTAIPDNLDGQGGNLPAWFPRAVDLRIHPATRYIREDGELRLEARIELLDQFNEPIKDVGTLRVELAVYDADDNPVMANGQPRRMRWTVELLTAEDHAKYWDAVSRCYLVPLNLEAPDTDLPQGLTRLWVTFRPAWPGSHQIPGTEDGRKPVEIRVDW